MGGALKFINRDRELAFLNRRWEEKSSELVIIYGKRRVGKTELIKEFIKDKPAVYFLGDRRTSGEQLRELSGLMAGHFNDGFLEKRGFSEWLDVFRYLNGKKKERFVFAVDEYPYMVEADRTVSSLFQKGWDEYLKDSGIFLILCGSSISMMESETLTYKAPLFGRRTGQVLVRPMTFRESRGFFPGKNFREFMSLYAVAGGSPAYLLQMSPELPFKENISRKVFSNTGYLYNEVEFILKEELREPKNYLAVLRAVSTGKRKFGEISNDTGLAKNVLTKYLQTLERLHVLNRELPATETNPLKSKKGLYALTDNFFRFWFRYVYPYKSRLEMGRLDEALGEVSKTFRSLEAEVYEEVCRELAWELYGRIFKFDSVGRWWDREQEIDIAAVNRKEKKILFGEVKWSRKPVGVNILKSLREKAGFVDWEKGEREEFFILFSRSGFTEGMLKAAKEQGVFLVEEDRLIHPA